MNPLENTALGLVETIGLTPAIEAADTALKTADVRLLGLECIGSGLVSIQLVGDVSSVQVAVAAARVAAARLGEVHSHTAIARTGEGLGRIVCPVALIASSPVDAAEEEPQEKAPEAMSAPQNGEEDIDLQAMSVTRLRRLARSFDGFSLSRQKIKFARKEELIELLRPFVQKP
ncbi:BMC domain-containing protein [Desulfobulbus rhabdoformis]|nr:BMC domain-containing protein [Desulfobulbus rhabdoformis]